MGKVVEQVKLTSLFEPEKSVEVEAVIDTGATMVVLPKDIVEAVSYTHLTLPTNREV